MSWRPASLSDVSRRYCEGSSQFGPALAEFLDDFYLDETNEGRQARLDPEPATTGDIEMDTWLGAVGEHLARRWGLRVPEWTEKPEFIGDPVMRFYPNTDGTRKILMVESPPAFRRRFLFTFAEPLMRARFPRERKASMPFP